jgi:hypothetical protein
VRDDIPPLVSLVRDDIPPLVSLVRDVPRRVVGIVSRSDLLSAHGGRLDAGVWTTGPVRVKL